MPGICMKFSKLLPLRRPPQKDLHGLFEKEPVNHSCLLAFPRAMNYAKHSWGHALYPGGWEHTETACANLLYFEQGQC